jgi:hypothetical protein
MKKIRPLSTQELDMYKKISELFGKPEVGIGDKKEISEVGLA